jgi:hypothetical protein
MMGLLDSIFVKLFTKEMDELISANGEVRIRFPKKFRVKINKEVTQVFDPKDKHFLLQFSIMNAPPGQHFDADEELVLALAENPNAELQSTGRYNCVCSATSEKNRPEITYVWRIGHREKRILATLLISGLKERDQIDKRIYLAAEFLQGIQINPPGAFA